MHAIAIAIVLLLMRALHPYAPDAPALAAAIVEEGATWEEAHLMVAIAYREGSFRLGVVGDQGHALCTYQLHGAPRAVLRDARLCTRIALARLRDARRLCPAQPLAAYAGARCGTKLAARISCDRLRLARRTVRRVLGPDAWVPRPEVMCTNTALDVPGEGP